MKRVTGSHLTVLREESALERSRLRSGSERRRESKPVLSLDRAMPEAVVSRLSDG